MPVQAVYIGGTVKPPVLNYLELLVAQGIHINQQSFQGFDIGDIAGQFTVVKRQTGLLTEKQGQIDLWQRVMILVFAVADLLQTLRIAGGGSGVVGQVLFFRPAFSLELKKPLPGLLGNRGEQLAASLGGNDFTPGMPMGSGPAGKATQGGFVLQN